MTAPVVRRSCRGSRLESECWPVLVHHFWRLEADAVEVAFGKEDEVDQFVAVRDGGFAGARFLGEVKDGGGDQDSFGVVFVVDMAGRYFEFGALHFEKAVGLK